MVGSCCRRVMRPSRDLSFIAHGAKWTQFGRFRPITISEQSQLSQLSRRSGEFILAPIGSVRLGSARPGSARPGPARFYSDEADRIGGQRPDRAQRRLERAESISESGGRSGPVRSFTLHTKIYLIGARLSLKSSSSCCRAT